MEGTSDKKFPVTFRFNIKISKEDANALIQLNKHLRLIYFICEDAVITIDSKEIKIRAGEMAVVPPDFLYNIRTESESAAYHSIIIDRDFYAKLDLITDELCTGQAINNPEIKNYFDQIVWDYKAHENFYKTKILSQVLSLLVCLSETSTGRYMLVPTTSERNKSEAVKKAIAYIEKNYHKTLSVDKLAEITKSDKYYFCRAFKDITGITPVVYINSYRCQRAHQMLADGNKSVHEVASLCGFDNLSYFTRTYKKYIGILPSKTAWS